MKKRIFALLVAMLMLVSVLALTSCDVMSMLPDSITSLIPSLSGDKNCDNGHADADGDERTGIKIVLKALEEPVRQIASNAGFEGAVVINNIKNSDKPGFGFDAATETYVDMFEAGIIDPTKVSRSALQNAASVASTILTTEAVVADKPDPKAEAAAAAAAAGAGMGGMY